MELTLSPGSDFFLAFEVSCRATLVFLGGVLWWAFGSSPVWLYRTWFCDPSCASLFYSGRSQTGRAHFFFFFLVFSSSLILAAWCLLAWNYSSLVLLVSSGTIHLVLIFPWLEAKPLMIMDLDKKAHFQFVPDNGSNWSMYQRKRNDK